jgi:TPR repeat protein
MVNLAAAYETGIGDVYLSLPQARHWYEKAAAAGNAQAKRWLAEHP